MDKSKLSDQELRIFCAETVSKWGQSSSYNPCDKVVCNRTLAHEAEYLYCFIKGIGEFDREYTAEEDE